MTKPTVENLVKFTLYFQIHIIVLMDGEKKKEKKRSQWGEKGMTKDEMVWWHNRLSGCEFG